MIDESSVRFELRLTGATHANATAEFLEVRPHSRQARQHVLELRELDLLFCLARARTRREDVEDELCPIHHAFASRVFDVLALRRGELVVEDDERRLGIADQCAELLDLSFAEVSRGVWSVDLLRDGAHDNGTRRVDELLELIEVLVDVVARGGAFTRRAYEDGALDRRGEGYQIPSDVKLRWGTEETNAVVPTGARDCKSSHGVDGHPEPSGEGSSSSRSSPLPRK